MTDEKIIEWIRLGKHDKAFVKLYKGYPAVEKLVKSKGGTKEDARDVFQEALIILCRKIKNDEFHLSAQLSTYLYSVCRFVWKDELQKRKVRKIDVSDLEKPEEDAHLKREEKFEQAEKALSKLGEKCRELLKMFYLRTQSMKNIAAKLGYSSEKSAKTQKYKCIERAKNHLMELQNL